jgi:uracil-DNA glycosylase family 4
MIINSKGSRSAPVWIICDVPVSTDKDKGYLYSGGLGHLYDGMLKDAGFTYSDIYITCKRPDTDDVAMCANLIGELNQYRPPIIIPLDEVGGFFIDEMNTKNTGESLNNEIEKYAGSIMRDPALVYEHYVIPSYGPGYVAANYKQRDIVVSCDLAKAKGELDYFKQHKALEPRPSPRLQIALEFDELIAKLDDYMHYDLLSDDIETVYPKGGTSAKTRSKWYRKHPGYPITIGLAPSRYEGISFQLFRESPVETRLLWQKLNKLHKKVRRLGQNFINFDVCFYEMLGFEVRVKDVIDTLIRHHVLWPELPHKLAFMTRQYTRQPFYKDDGNGWSGKNMGNLMLYNALDCCTTFNVYEEQENEFNERPHLK